MVEVGLVLTVFGGYHPSLQQLLVMKHGGYKDLLDSEFTKIDREIGVRAQFVTDTLEKRVGIGGGGGGGTQNHEEVDGRPLQDRHPFWKRGKRGVMKKIITRQRILLLDVPSSSAVHH